MKPHIFLAFVLSLVSLCANALTPAQIEIQTLVNEEAKSLPMNLAEGLYLQSYTYDVTKNEVLIEYLYEGLQYKYVFSQEGKLAASSGLQGVIRGTQDDRLTDALINAGASIKYNYNYKDTGEGFYIKFTADEINDLRSNPMTSREMSLNSLQNDLVALNNACPMLLSETFQLTSADIRDGRFVLFCSIDCPYTQLVESCQDLIDGYSGLMKEANMRLMINKLATAGLGIRYSVRGSDSKQRVNIDFSFRDLCDILDIKLMKDATH